MDGLAAGSLSAARRLAERFGGAFVPLGERHGMARVVLPGPPPFNVDLADLPWTDPRPTWRRATTIDALAVDLAALLQGPAAIRDPTGGLADLAAGRLRACRPSAFADDPVRVLRLIRLAHQLDFAVEPETEGSRTERPPLSCPSQGSGCGTS